MVNSHSYFWGPINNLENNGHILEPFLEPFLAPRGAQGEGMYVCASV